MALRDAGANFAMNFTRVPEVKAWLDSLPATNSGAASGTAQALNTSTEATRLGEENP